jgi:transcriptional regulator with XRE-family HTH domain
MAIELGLSKGTYERIESDARQARRGELIAIAQLTGQDLSLFGASSDDGEAPNLSPLPAAVKADNSQ